MIKCIRCGKEADVVFDGYSLCLGCVEVYKEEKLKTKQEKEVVA